VSIASIAIEASSAEVWDALVTPAIAKEYFFGATVHSDWKEGSPITFTGGKRARSDEFGRACYLPSRGSLSRGSENRSARKIVQISSLDPNGSSRDAVVRQR
jgi:hypothetical protein